MTSSSEDIQISIPNLVFKMKFLVAVPKFVVSNVACRLRATGGDLSTYELRIRWSASADEVSCGPTTSDQVFVTEDPLAVEFSVDRVTWYPAPQQVKLFDVPRCTSLSHSEVPLHLSLIHI